jgi:DNA-binding NarL/FixJ family response regulator/class 3 adenylate cyclase
VLDPQERRLGHDRILAQPRLLRYNPRMTDLPQGTVTLLWADLEDAGGPAGRSPEEFRDRMAEHRSLVREAVEQTGGQEVDARGVEILAVFVRVRDAVEAAATIMQAHHDWAARGGSDFDARVALHTGEPIAAEGGYLGLDVHRVVKMCGAGHGGQILLTQTVANLIRDGELPGELVDLGEVELPGVPRPEHVYQLSLPGLRASFPPLRQAEAADAAESGGGGDGPRVVLAEDAVLLREGIAALLERNGCEVVGQAGTPDELLLKVRSYSPDVAVVDVRMPPTHTDEGLRAAHEIRAQHPEVGVLVLSQYVEPAYAVELLAENASGVGYLLKDRVNDVDEFVSAVRRVADGGTAFDPQVVSELVGRRRREGVLDVLSPREREVLALMAEGRSNQAISERLYLSARAVERHVTSIFTKLRLPAGTEDNRRVLAVLAFLKD